MNQNLKGKRALVTGGSRGIGAAIVARLAREGADVALTYSSSPDRAEEVARAAQDLGVKAISIQADSADAQAVTSAVDRAARELGGLDILVNNAGMTRDNLFMRMKNEEWDEVLAVNLTAAFHLTRAVLRGMMKQRFGRIISITSVVGVAGNPGQANYAASKAGLIGMSKSLAYEVASRNITVNTVAPGFITSAMTDELNDKQRETILTKVPAGRLGTAEEVAGCTVFLASDAAAYITGHTLNVNGGMLMI